jgi:hypothetical protein
MTSSTWDFGAPLEADFGVRARSQLESVTRTIRIAIALIGRGRQVDLTGLDHQVGMLCAQTLDLGWDRARELRPKLAGLLSEIDHLATLHQQEQPTRRSNHQHAS